MHTTEFLFIFPKHIRRNIQAVCAQIRKAHATWSRVGQVLWSEQTPPQVAAKFYTSVVQAVLLYCNETWVLSPTALARLEGFHIRAAYRMARWHKPCRSPGNAWIYPKLEDVLEECGLCTVAAYIETRWQTIATYVATHPILDKCRQGERRGGAVPHHWWWEQKMDLDLMDATGSNE